MDLSMGFCVVGLGSAFDAICGDPSGHGLPEGWAMRRADSVAALAGGAGQLLEGLDPARNQIFVAVDQHALNYARLELYGAARLRGLRMLCLHRHNPLQTQTHGVRPLVCSYHGWGYDNSGAPANIPFEREVFRFPAAERACLRLRSFALEIIGNLVFVNLSEHPLPISEQFDASFLASLGESSLTYDDEVMFTTLRTRLNWKLAYENLRDSHHPRYVHSRSLYQEVKFAVRLDESAVAIAQRMQEHGVHDRQDALRWLRSFSAGGPDEPMVNPIHYAWHDEVERYGDQDWYYNWLAFPNLHIASGSGGHSFIVEHHIPVSAARTDLIVYYVTARKRRKYRSSVAVLHAHMMGARTVLREDIQVMENIQAQLHAGGPRARLGDYEYANHVISRWLLDATEGSFVL